jgi:hypothetical protein
MSFGRTEQEERIESIYRELDDAFKKASKLKDGAKLQALLKDITNKLKDAKTCVKRALSTASWAPYRAGRSGGRGHPGHQSCARHATHRTSAVASMLPLTCQVAHASQADPRL